MFRTAEMKDIHMIRLLFAFALASPLAAKEYLVTPATYAARMAALASGDTMRIDPSVPKTATFPSINTPKEVRVYNPPITLILTGYTFGSWYPGDISGIVVRGGTFDGGDAHNAILGMFRNTKLLGIATVRGTAAFAGGFENVYIENLDCSGSRSDCLDTSRAHGLEINGMNCHDPMPTPGAHPDCVQMRALTDGDIDGVIFRNVYVGGHMQGVDDYGSPMPLHHIVVDKLRAYIDMYGAMQFTSCKDCSVNDVIGTAMPGLRTVHLHPFNQADADAHGFTGPVKKVSLGKTGVDPGPWVRSAERFPVVP